MSTGLHWDSSGRIRNGPVRLPTAGPFGTHTPPACWGPMITTEFRGGHEVTRPIRVENAEPGDALVVHIKDVEVTSVATSTGSMAEREDAFGSDPFVDHRCPECGTEWPDSVVEGTGEDAIHVRSVGPTPRPLASIGYTVAFDEDRSVGLTVGPDGAADLAERADEATALPDHSRQHPILLYNPMRCRAHSVDSVRSSATSGRRHPSNSRTHTMPETSASSSSEPTTTGASPTNRRLRPGRWPHGLDDVSPRRDAHLPVEIDGAGLYVGDLHANQGDGELSLHTTDVSGRTELEVSVIKDLDIDGPLLLPNESDLPVSPSRTRTLSGRQARPSPPNTTSITSLMQRRSRLSGPARLSTTPRERFAGRNARVSLADSGLAVRSPAASKSRDCPACPALDARADGPPRRTGARRNRPRTVRPVVGRRLLAFTHLASPERVRPPRRTGPAGQGRVVPVDHHPHTRSASPSASNRTPHAVRVDRRRIHGSDGVGFAVLDFLAPVAARSRARIRSRPHRTVRPHDRKDRSGLMSLLFTGDAATQPKSILRAGLYNATRFELERNVESPAARQMANRQKR